jgi:hypothetical protein
MIWPKEYRLTLMRPCRLLPFTGRRSIRFHQLAVSIGRGETRTLSPVFVIGAATVGDSATGFDV